jgi:hypothetical protein
MIFVDPLGIYEKSKPVWLNGRLAGSYFVDEIKAFVKKLQLVSAVGR